MKYAPYSTYKPSGIEWMGEVPAHWETLALKRKFLVVNGGTPSSSEGTYWEGDIPWFTPEDLGRIETKVIISSRRNITPDGLSNCGASISPKGSVLISTRAPIGHVAIMGVDGCCNQGCRILVPEGSQVTADFGFYVMLASNSVLNSMGKGTTFLELSSSALGAHSIPLPDHAEQQSITSFLDHKTSQIDHLVAKKRDLIERLNEKRTALISQTVTRGLPPAAARAAGLSENQKIKPSGINFPTEVPRDWTVTKVWLERVARNIEYQDGNHGELHPKAEDYVDDGIPFVMANHLNKGRVDYEACKFIEPEQAASLRIGFAMSGDVLLTHKGTIGRVAMVADSRFPYLMLTPQVTYYRCLRNISPRFLFWFFQSKVWQDQMQLVSSLGTTRGYVGLLDQRSLNLLRPPLPEQIAIADYLNTEVEKLDELTSKIEAALERLLEYRTSLITSAVTGKIDVRKTVAA